MGPITGSIRAGPGPTVKACVNWLSPSTSRRIWSLIWNSLVAAPVAVCATAGPASSMSAARRTIILAVMGSLDGYAFRQVARPIHVAAAQHGDMVRQELQGNHRQDRRQQRRARRHRDLVIREPAEIAVALARDLDDPAAPCLH